MYKNYLDHEHYGRLWYTIVLRNLDGMGNSLEQNLEAGPIFIVVLCDYGVIASGDSVATCMKNLHICLDIRAERNGALPSTVPPMSLYQRWKMRRFNKRCERDGSCNPVK